MKPLTYDETMARLANTKCDTKHKVNPVMPCGYDRTNIKLLERVKHYRGCPHPACKARLAAFENIKQSFRDAAKKGEIKIVNKRAA